MTQPPEITQAYEEAQREQDTGLSLMSDKVLIDNFVRELDKRGYNLHIVKAIRTLFRKLT